MPKFITGKELFEEVYDIIFNAKKELLIVSPYIRLDDYFKHEIFKRHRKNANLHIAIAFGKNEKNPSLSIQASDFDYFREFPNISIVYIPNLHAKFYGNEKKGLITSINLYDYSFKNNVEFGVVSDKSLINLSSIDEVAWDKSVQLLQNNYAIYVRRPNFKKGLLSKSYLGSETLHDYVSDLLSGKRINKIDFSEFPDELNNESHEFESRRSREQFNFDKGLKEQKYFSATALGKPVGKSFNEVIEIMVSHGLIEDKSKITMKGIRKGIRIKENKNGEEWIVYPEKMKDLL